MADTRVQLQIEDWVRRRWLPEKYGHQFRPAHLQLKAGGYFDFDAVSTDDTIIANISTSSGITAGGNLPTAKLQKLRADMLFLLMVPATRRLIVLTERNMYDLCQKEKKSGRVPIEIEFVHAELPADLASKLAVSRQKASEEMTTRQK